MAADPNETTPEGRLKNTWNLLVQVGVWISTFAASMLLPPVSGLAENDADPTARLLKYTVFIIAVVVGLSFILAKKFNKKKHLWFWIILTVLFLATSVVCVNRNYHLNNSLVCTCNHRSVIKGTTYREPQVVSKFYPRGVDCSILCEHFVNNDGIVIPEKVWTEPSINDSRRTLFLSYLICFPAVALTVISIVQALYCSSKRP
jgi:hypothetical protein